MVETILLIAARTTASVLSFLGVLLVPFGLPGNWLSVILAGLAVWLGWGPEWFDFWLIAGAAVLAEILEFGTSLVTAKRSGAGKAGMWGSILGSFVGAIAATPIVPPLGTFFGAAAGAFAGAVLFESGIANRDPNESIRAGFGAAVGTVLGRLLKLWLAVFQAVWLSLALWGLV